MLKVIFILFLAWKDSKFNALNDPLTKLFKIKEIWNARGVQIQANYSIGYTGHGSLVLFPQPLYQDSLSFPPPPEFYCFIPDVEAWLAPNCIYKPTRDLLCILHFASLMHYWVASAQIPNWKKKIRQKSASSAFIYCFYITICRSLLEKLPWIFTLVKKRHKGTHKGKKWILSHEVF